MLAISPTSLVCLALVFLVEVKSHGRLLYPPGRSTMWRFGWQTAVNYNDNQMFCGGFNYQWNEHGGKCGVCGDPIGDKVKENEWGGIYMSGMVVEHYRKGQQITIRVELTANHKGYVEFKLCDQDTEQNKATHECLNRHVLQLVDGTGSRFSIYTGDRLINVTVALPADVTCDKCMLQWRYHSGNSHGTDPDTGKVCGGCGPQEEFYSCSDIRISNEGGTFYKPPPPTTTTTTVAPPTIATYRIICDDGLFRSSVLYSGVKMDAWCQTTCSEPIKPSCPSSHCRCRNEDASNNPTTVSTLSGSSTHTTTTPAPITTTHLLKRRLVCVDSHYEPTSDYALVTNMLAWCVERCFASRYNTCPVSHCQCVRPQLTRFVYM